MKNLAGINESKKLSLKDAIKKADKVAPNKKPNEREHSEINKARQFIIDAMPKLRYEMTWEEFKPYGIAMQKQSAWGQPDSHYERLAKWEYDWGKKNQEKSKRMGY